MKKLVLRLLLFCLLIVPLVGCWDLREIEELNFVMGVAFDPVKEEDKENEANLMHGHGHEDMFRMTYQIAVPEALKVEGGGSGSKKAYFNITSPGLTDMKISRNIGARISRRVNLEHLQVIIVNQELARKGLIAHLLDFFFRDHEMRRNDLVFVSTGEAQSLFEVNVPLEDMPARYIQLLAEQHTEALSIPKMLSMGEMADKIIGENSYLIPRVVGGTADIQFRGAAVFHGKTNKMIDWLGEDDLEGYNLVTGESPQGVLQVPFQDKGLFDFEILDLNPNTSYERKQGEDHFQVYIKTEGVFAENWIDNLNISDQKTLNQLEKAVAQEIKKKSEAVINKMQDEIQADVFEFLPLVRIKEYAYWKEIKHKWDGKDGAFSKAHIDVEVDAEIRQYMTNEKLERQ